MKLRLRCNRFANHKAPCTAIWQQPLQSVLALRGCSTTDLMEHGCMDRWMVTLLVMTQIHMQLCFANHKAPCTAIWQQPLQSVLALRGCSATDLFILHMQLQQRQGVKIISNYVYVCVCVCVCVFQCKHTALLRPSGSAQGGEMAVSVVYFRIMHRLDRPHFVWEEYLHSVLEKVR